MSNVRNSITGPVTGGLVVQCGDDEHGDVHNSITGPVTGGSVLQCGNVSGDDLTAFFSDDGPADA